MVIKMQRLIKKVEGRVADSQQKKLNQKLLEAIFYGNPNSVIQCIHNGADVNAGSNRKDLNGYAWKILVLDECYPLLLAMRLYCDPSSFGTILGLYKNPPLQNRKDIIQLLLNAGADPANPSVVNWTSLLGMSQLLDSMKIQQACPEASADLLDRPIDLDPTPVLQPIQSSSGNLSPGKSGMFYHSFSNTSGNFSEDTLSEDTLKKTL